jgi:hypothetical protein
LASRSAPTVVERLPQHAAHTPAMHQVSQEQVPTMAMRGEQTIRSRECCCEGDGREPSCPSSCPAGASCASHGSLTALDAGEHLAAPAPVNAPEPCGTGEYPDSWSGNLDTPPPRS